MTTLASVFNVVGFAGSLRRASCNRALLRAATELAPPALRTVIYELDGIPLYDAAIEAAGVPPSVVQLGDAIRQADALFVAALGGHEGRYPSDSPGRLSARWSTGDSQLAGGRIRHPAGPRHGRPPASPTKPH